MLQVSLFAFAQCGGIVHYSTSLANALARHLPVRVLVPDGADTSGYDPDVEVVYLPVPMDCSAREICRAPSRMIRFSRVLQALEGPQDHVVHFLNRHEYLTFAAPLVHNRLVVTMHDPRPHRGEASPRKLLANWMLRRKARRIFVFGNILKQHLVEQGVPESRITVVPHGSFSRYACAPQLEPEQPPIGLFFGRILPYKGVNVLLEAAPLIREQVPGFRLLIAGEGDVRPYRALLDRELATGHCELINRFVSDEEMGTLLARSSVILLPYLEATQSGVVPLAYGAQRPVIATAVGAIPEIVDSGRTGLLVPPDDAPALAASTVKLLSDPKLASEVARAGRIYAEEHLSWEAVAESTIPVYEEIAAP
ncbi:MAG: glycosyltransferase family 4 protein [Armatimonadia bacterium]